MPRRKEPRIPDAILDQLLAGADPNTVFDPNGLLDELKKALAERVLNAEMDHHLAGEEPGNRCNGYGKQTVITDTSPPSPTKKSGFRTSSSRRSKTAHRGTATQKLRSSTSAAATRAFLPRTSRSWAIGP